ncbi:hypothetical protein GCM10010191_89220 [Actinomadura vinacea]|uniref:SAF domain-containing protein n=1 Tax=Actinomadura vinacea TaxID=115336 RepID=A0ABN3KD01_9ACTN
MTSAGKTLPKPRRSKESGGLGRAVSGRVARQRRPGWIAAGVMLMALAVLANVYLFQSSSERVSVVRLVRDVPVGQQISRADLNTAMVAVDATVHTIPARQLAEVVGRRAAVGLRQGTLLSASQLTVQAHPAPGEALVTVPLKTSEVPPGLAPGWEVRVVTTPGAPGRGDAPAAGEGAPVKDVAALVDHVGDPNAEGTVTVSLVVVDGDSSMVARQAAAGLVSLVVTARRG